MKPSPKTSVQHRSTFAKGGTGHMIKPQSAGPAKPAMTGKAQTAAPGRQRAVGGPRTSGSSSSVPAKAGRTGADSVKKGR
jgi:hypothetical protein